MRKSPTHFGPIALSTPLLLLVFAAVRGREPRTCITECR